jgi:hypothetical protein
VGGTPLIDDDIDWLLQPSERERLVYVELIHGIRIGLLGDDADIVAAFEPLLAGQIRIAPVAEGLVASREKGARQSQPEPGQHQGNS